VAKAGEKSVEFTYKLEVQLLVVESAGAVAHDRGPPGASSACAYRYCP
jgi:hypothetical protein